MHDEYPRSILQLGIGYLYLKIHNFNQYSLSLFLIVTNSCIKTNSILFNDFKVKTIINRCRFIIRSNTLTTRHLNQTSYNYLKITRL